MSEVPKRFTVQEVERRALRLFARNDLKGAFAYVDHLRKRPGVKANDPLWNACIQTWLLNDQIAFATSCLGVSEIKEWIDHHSLHNKAHIYEHCPELFVYMCKAGRASWHMQGLSAHFSPEQKQRALAGDTEHKVLTRLVKDLQKNPRIWMLLDSDWAGKDGTASREKAIEFGWSKELQVRILRDGLTTNKELEGWSNIVAYPYSVCLVHMFLRGHQKFTSFFALYEKMKQDVYAHPVDIALASILQRKAQRYDPTWQLNYRFTGHPDASKVTPEQMDYLTNMVNVQISLDSLQALADMLIHDKLAPMLGMRTIECFDLPVLGGP